MPENPEQDPVSQNRLIEPSDIRNNTKGVRYKIALGLHERFPELTANQLTAVGTFMVSGASLIAAARSNESSFAERMGCVGIYTAGSLVDAIDGELARIRIANGYTDSEMGAEFDFTNDRFQETVVYICQMFTSLKREDIFGAAGAFSAAITSSEPSIQRAGCEALGVPVSENGNDNLSKAGTRLGRAILAGIPIALPQLTGVVGFFTSYANMHVALDRRSDLKEAADKIDVTPGQVKTAEFKIRSGRSIQVLATVGALAVRRVNIALAA
jgi:phosphatidylglycerophosphate synthase